MYRWLLLGTARGGGEKETATYMQKGLVSALAFRAEYGKEVPGSEPRTPTVV
jgi:hypothetical protein